VPADRPLASRTDTGGRIVFVNRAFTDVSGFTAEELVGSPHNIVWHRTCRRRRSLIYRRRSGRVIRGRGWSRTVGRADERAA
jgi:PAS domain S-box-containing protein